MKVLLADKLHPSALSALEEAGYAVTSAPSLKAEALVEALGEHRPDVLVVRSTKVQAEHFAAWPGLALVVRAGAGVNTIDLVEAGTRGVFVANCPGKNAVAVAELTLGLVLSVDRRLPDNVAQARAGVWDKAGFSKADGVKGKTLALLGYGAIGRSVAKRAQAFGMNVVAWSRSLTPERAAAEGIGHAATPHAAAAAADILSVHVALTPATRGLVDAALLKALRPGALLVNTARAEVVDQAALLAALDTQDLWAALDVFEDEPAAKTGTFDSPLARHERVYLTHHIGASTTQAQTSVGREVVRVIEGFAQGGRVPNCVNLVEQSTAAHGVIVRHKDRVGALAAVLEVLKRHDLNVQEMENACFAGGRAAVARIQLHGEPTPDVVDALDALDDVLHVAPITLAVGGPR